MRTVREWIAGIPRGIVAQQDNADGTGALLRFTVQDVFRTAAEHPDLVATSQAALLVHTSTDGVKRIACDSITELTQAVRCYFQEALPGFNGAMWTSVLQRENIDVKQFLDGDSDTLDQVREWFTERAPKEVFLTRVA